MQMRSLAYLFTAVFTIASSLAWGQITGLDSRDRLKALTELKRSQPVSATNAYEAPVQPSEYLLGPGDELELSVWGDFESIYSLKIGPDGKVAAPTVGVLDFNGLTLKEAEEELQRRIVKIYSKSPVSLRLLNPRQIKVSISGVVEKPGLYAVSSLDRLSELIESAGGLQLLDHEPQMQDVKDQVLKQTNESEKKKEDEAIRIQSSLRHLKIISRDGTNRDVDYLRYLKAGDLNSNPFLQNGDRVFVPVRDEQVGVVSVYGAVRDPGEVEYIEGDNVFDLIEIAGGFKPDAKRSEIEIVRFENGVRQEPIIINADQTNSADSQMRIQQDDRVYIRSLYDFHKKNQVKVTGEVRFPGYYPIAEDRTTLSDILVACGGVTNKANLNNALVIRRQAEDNEDPEFERLKNIPVSDMKEMEYEYFKTRSRIEEQAVVVDFASLLQKSDLSQDIRLLDRDEINIPVLSPTVNIIGQVNRPGLVLWVPGEDIDYYIQKAGGFSWNARKSKLRLIKARTGKWVEPDKKNIIEIGDTIFIPEKQEIEYWELWKDIVLVVSQLATIILVARTVR